MPNLLKLIRESEPDKAIVGKLSEVSGLFTAENTDITVDKQGCELPMDTGHNAKVCVLKPDNGAELPFQGLAQKCLRYGKCELCIRYFFAVFHIVDLSNASAMMKPNVFRCGHTHGKAEGCGIDRADIPRKRRVIYGRIIA